jgi:uncharacterized repeat protein (TIGR03803 family)
VFKLTPSPTGWEETVLWNFSVSNISEGAEPQCQLIFDKTGALYGTTTIGGPSEAGTVFQLKPPVAGQDTWSMTGSTPSPAEPTVALPLRV